MIWFLLAPLQILAMLLCYITNPIVCLFCDEEGELHGFWHLWQTWDDSCNPRFYAVEKAPKIFQYDYDRHYVEYKKQTPQLAKYGRERWFARLIDPHFTWEERIQRYFCRVLWLTRNCGYGFAFYLFGNDVDLGAYKETEFVKDEKHYVKIGWDKSQPLWKRPWCVKSDWFYTEHWQLDAFLGWKINGPATGRVHTMIANRLSVLKHSS